MRATGRRTEDAHRRLRRKGRSPHRSALPRRLDLSLRERWHARHGRLLRSRLQAPVMPADSDPYENRRLWRTELAATLALGWPLVLTNLAQTGLTTADVILMGWLGPAALAAGALGTNLYFAFLIFGIGVDERDRAAHRPGARPQAPLGPRRPPHGAPRLVGLGRDLDPGLGRAVERRADSSSARPGAGARRRGRRPSCARCNGRFCRRSGRWCCAVSSPPCSGRAGSSRSGPWRCRSISRSPGCSCSGSWASRRSGSPAPGLRPPSRACSCSSGSRS